MEKKNTSSERFKRVRSMLGLTQQELADRLLLTRNYVAKIESGDKEPSMRVLRDVETIRLEAEDAGHMRVHQGNTSSTQNLGDMRSSSVEEPSARYDAVVALSSSFAAENPKNKRPSTRHDCESFFKRILDAAEANGDPDNYPHIMRVLKKHIPPEEWEKE